MGDMANKDLVFTAMSGGVDSAVAAALLVERGFQVVGIHMQTWRYHNSRSLEERPSESITSAKIVAEALGIPFVSLDLRKLFYEDIVKAFIKQYLAGNTPNPCLFCNPQVKWGVLQKYALDQGADFFATGHYAQINRLRTGKVKLLRGVDRLKDQSYVLSMLTQHQLQGSLLPLGKLTKGEVRQIAKKRNLPVANQEDSQDLCFLGDVDYREFLQHFSPSSSEPGEIVTVDEEVVGEHQGLAFYTIGQRKGIRIAAAEPYYVVGKDMDQNRLIVGFADQTGKNSLVATNANWISGKPPRTKKPYLVMVRYRANPEPATLVAISEDQFRLEFMRRLRGVAPGQVAAIYRDDVCLGGGVIQTSD